MRITGEFYKVTGNYYRGHQIDGYAYVTADHRSIRSPKIIGGMTDSGNPLEIIGDIAVGVKLTVMADRLGEENIPLLSMNQST